jgi:hypothetical protein
VDGELSILGIFRERKIDGCVAGRYAKFGMVHYTGDALAAVIHFAGVAEAREKFEGGAQCHV